MNLTVALRLLSGAALVSGLAAPMVEAGSVARPISNAGVPYRTESASESGRVGTAVQRLLLAGREEPAELFSLSQRLAKLGIEALPHLFGLLAESGPASRSSDIARTPLSDGERRAVIQALARAPRRDLVAMLDRQAAEIATERERLAGIEVLARCSTAADIGRLLFWATPSEPNQRAGTDVRRALSKALGSVLQRDPTALTPLTEAFSGAHRSLLPAMLEAFGEHPSRRTLEALGDLLGQHVELEPFILAEIASFAPQVHGPFDRTLRRAVAKYLGFPHDAVRRFEAVRAVRRLGDTDSVLALVDLLHDEDLRLRKAAYEALRGITGAPLPADEDTWRDWHAEALRWWRDEAPELIRDATYGEPAETMAALQVLGRYRLFRDEIAGTLVEILDGHDRHRKALACATLGHLGSVLAEARLIELSNGRDEALSAAARKALARIRASQRTG